MDILIINQHGDNRGDEAALRGMLDAVEANVPGARFTVLHQFSSADSKVQVPQDVTWLPIIISPIEAVRLALALGLRILRLPDRWVAGPIGRAIIDAYRAARVVISAPGGPYFGELYAGHEPVHWFFVWMARAHRRPLVLYAPSAGPFRRRVRNLVRRYTIRSFDRIVVREELSARHVADLLRLPIDDVPVAADSAFQSIVEPADRAAVLGAAALGARFILVVSALEWRWPDHPAPAAAQQAFEDAVIAAIERVSKAAATHVIFAPQLHGPRHRDRDYLLRLADRVSGAASVDVLPEAMSSIEQRAIFGAADLVIAARYHPAIFAVSAGVPVVCIAYEHKAIGMMQRAGLGDLVLRIDDVERDRLVDLVEGVLGELRTIRDRVQQVGPRLRSEAAISTEAVVDLLRR